MLSHFHSRIHIPTGTNFSSHFFRDSCCNSCILSDTNKLRSSIYLERRFYYSVKNAVFTFVFYKPVKLSCPLKRLRHQQRVGTWNCGLRLETPILVPCNSCSTNFPTSWTVGKLWAKYVCHFSASDKSSRPGWSSVKCWEGCERAGRTVQ